MKRKLQIPSYAQSIFLGMGSIFSLASMEVAPTPRRMARADRDTKSMRSDFTRVGRDIRSAIDKTRKESSKK